ncbi:hypothetical protein M430DRAFT_32097 [Amorphotheca resinae ATCC 22711]|uniref:Uncharacterized protein n=1 Tax=Amorphotheca resinae ATCC 22711 TaxID=857342 RepID=A0A2T3BD29_AMORE|nr:hypothetical protein M430DRAFT_32097 [Amorphotheca resinae ATCC 22711]PSS27311.1 hypothetical protein M430DRAFT_32097 [Amorphotheca resinae ATCC 22711]
MPCTHSTPLLDSTRHTTQTQRGLYRLYRQDKSGQDKISKGKKEGKKEGKNEGKNEGKKEGRKERKKQQRGSVFLGSLSHDFISCLCSKQSKNYLLFIHHRTQSQQQQLNPIHPVQLSKKSKAGLNQITKPVHRICRIGLAARR